MTATLISRQDAEFEIAALTAGPCCVAVMEDRAFVGKDRDLAFEDKWLPLGSICLKPSPQPDGVGAAAREHQRALLASEGAFEWSLRSGSDIGRELARLLGDADEQAARRALDAIAAIGVRMGLVNPTFDPDAIEGMPFRRTVTVVSDTSGVLQGGLNFIVRHLPKARVKVPAIVQMEIRNSSHRFFRIRRDRKGTGKKQRTTKQLMEHLASQGAERVLLRLELQDDVEIERTYLLGDPLRSAFVPDSHSTLADLQLSVPLAPYVDRLILEAARHHQAQSEPSHAVLLLTSDQGLARMALAEGVRPLYFRTIRAEEVFGQRLTGRPLDPFTGEPRPVSLASLLWELATAFGRARLASDYGVFTVSALGEDLPWSPYHSIDDLLWYEVNHTVPRSPTSHQVAKEGEAPEAASAGTSSDSRSTETASFQRMSVDNLFALICALDDRQSMAEPEIRGLLNLSSYSTSHYRRFLGSAGCITTEGNRWMATDRLKETAIAARDEDALSLQGILAHAPSFRELVRRTHGLNNGELLDLSDMGQSSRTYRMLGEITRLCASVGRSAVYPTLNRPEPADFAELALARFRELARNETIVATGLWLESLIRHEGIHPEEAIRSLERASEKGLLRRSTEGSTAQTQYDDHVVHVLRVEDGVPIAKPIRLYRGDYLIPNKASVSLRLEEAKP